MYEQATKTEVEVKQITIPIQALRLEMFISNDDNRMHLKYIRIENNADMSGLRAIATNGHILAIFSWETSNLLEKPFYLDGISLRQALKAVPKKAQQGGGKYKDGSLVFRDHTYYEINTSIGYDVNYPDTQCIIDSANKNNAQCGKFGVSVKYLSLIDKYFTKVNHDTSHINIKCTSDLEPLVINTNGPMLNGELFIILMPVKLEP